TRAGGRIEHASTRYEGGGAATKAAAASIIAEAMAERASIYRQLPKLYSGRRPARWVAAIAFGDAAMAMDATAETWRRIADRHRAEAEAIERAALPAFTDDGLEFVPGRGRVRRLIALPDLTASDLRTARGQR
ncbi:MAG TPA: hypothetical protein VGR74_08775, partial [Actinomycetota bacterium]|nr:hypothetical protein [Actinomycetota bacterium]